MLIASILLRLTTVVGKLSRVSILVSDRVIGCFAIVS